MNFNFSTYRLNSDDTLESVADKLGITAENLKRYHNTYCDLNNLIGNSLKGISEIIIPPEEKIEEYKSTNSILNQKQNLPSRYLTSDFYATNYDVREIIKQTDQDDIEISYRINLTVKDSDDKGFIIESKTSNFLKNNNIPDDKISAISIACMDSIYPITLSVPKQGKIKSIFNHDVLLKKFENKKSDLEDFFIGEINKKYIDTFHNTLKDENFLLKQISSSLLYQSLFLKTEWLHNSKTWDDYFYITPNSFPVLCHLNTEYSFENPNLVQIIIKGTVDEKSTLQEVLKGVKTTEQYDDFIQGEITLKYTTSKDNKQLKQLFAEIIIYHEGKTYKQHNVTVTSK